jgi:predicted regulator of Ras-like GTPase activity (Roadblock/LC7/MglB family)
VVRKKKGDQEFTTFAEPVAVEETATENDLCRSLEEIKNCEGVIGYILRNTSSASIDLKDPTKITDYAILSSLAFDAGGDFSELFDLGDVRSVVIEGKSIKMLSTIVNENKISVFMEKNTDVEKILRKLSVS